MPRAFDPHYWVAVMACWWYGMWKRPCANESLAAGTRNAPTLASEQAVAVPLHVSTMRSL